MAWGTAGDPLLSTLNTKVFSFMPPKSAPGVKRRFGSRGCVRWGPDTTWAHVFIGAVALFCFNLFVSVAGLSTLNTLGKRSTQNHGTEPKSQAPAFRFAVGFRSHRTPPRPAASPIPIASMRVTIRGVGARFWGGASGRARREQTSVCRFVG